MVIIAITNQYPHFYHVTSRSIFFNNNVIAERQTHSSNVFLASVKMLFVIHAYQHYKFFGIFYSYSIIFFNNVALKVVVTTITYKIFETKKFQVTGKVSFLFFKSFLLVSTNLLFWRKDLALRYHSMKFRRFSDIFNFPRS